MRPNPLIPMRIAMADCPSRKKDAVHFPRLRTPIVSATPHLVKQYKSGNPASYLASFIDELGRTR